VGYLGFGSISSIVHILARIRFTTKAWVVGAMLIMLCR
jgi:hypothetical protein